MAFNSDKNSFYKRMKPYHINLFLCITILIFMVELCTESVRYGNGSVFGPAMMFTNDSNLFLAISCGILGTFQLISSKKEDIIIPQWAYLLKYMAVCQVILTCLVVLVFLVGIVHDMELLGGLQMIYFHIITPVAGTLSWLLLEAKAFRIPRKRYLLMPLLPLFLYAVAYIIEVIVIGYDNGGWHDIYHLNIGSLWPVSFILMHLVMLGISWVLSLRNK